MSKVVLGMSVSLDGIAAPQAADADGMAVFTAILGWQFPLRSWREQQGQEGGEDSVDSRVWAGNFARFGYTFVTGGIEAAVGQARAAAGGKDVLLAGGVSIGQQALAAGLVDEVVLHVTPVLLGRGVRLFGAAQADLHCIETVHGEGAVHLRYEVR